MFDLEPFTTNILIYIALFVGVLLAFEGAQQILFRSETRGEARNRRMKMIKNGASSEEVLQLLRDPASIGKSGNRGLIARLRRLWMQSGLTFGPIWAFLCSAALGGASFIAASRVLSPDMSLAVSVVAAIAIPLLVLLGLKQARLSKLTTQLPDALDLMGRGLKVGHPIAVTVGNVAADMPDPIGTEFGLIQDQINYGDDVGTAFRDFADRVGTEDANYLAVSVGIQHGTGGNLARILNVLSEVIRDRHIMRKKIKAISAEGRLSSLILTCLPLLIYLSIELATPSFYGDVRNDPWFPYFVYTVVGLTLVQGLILHRLVRFKI